MTGQPEKTDRIQALEDLRNEFVRVARADGDRVSSHRRRTLAAVLSGVALVGVGVTIALVFLVDSGPRPASPPPGGLAASGPLYGSLPELIQNSDLIVVGVVDEVLPPVTIEDEGSEFPTREFSSVVNINEALKGSAPSGSVTVKTQELAFGSGSKEWRTPGRRVVLFLSPSRETTGLHILANTNSAQTAYLIDGEDLVATVEDPLSNEVGDLSLAELRQAVDAAQ